MSSEHHVTLKTMLHICWSTTKHVLTAAMTYAAMETSEDIIYKNTA